MSQKQNSLKPSGSLVLATYQAAIAMGKGDRVRTARKSIYSKNQALSVLIDF